jgi:hypothetical protein
LLPRSGFGICCRFTLLVGNKDGATVQREIEIGRRQQWRHLASLILHPPRGSPPTVRPRITPSRRRPPRDHRRHRYYYHHRNARRDHHTDEGFSVANRWTLAVVNAACNT